MSLKDKAADLKSGKSIKFMEGKEKGETLELLDKEYVTLRDFDFINGNEGEYAVFIIDEIPDNFFFGGQVLTKWLKTFSEEEKAELQADGFKAKFSERKSKETKRKYISVEPFEDPEDLPF